MKSSFSKVNLTLVVASVIATALMALSCQKSGVGPGFRSPNVSFNPSASEFTEVTADCVKSLSNTPLNAGGQTLWLGVYESPWPVDEGQTKSAPVTAVHNTFEVSGYGYMGDWNTQNKANLFFKQTMTKSGSSWTGDTDMRWPGSDYKVRFAAVSPAVANTSNLSWTSTATTAGNPVISYTVNDAVASQLDLLECVTDVADGSGSSVPASGVAMTFQHALTAVTFKVSDFSVAGTVKSVTIEDVYNSGSHVVGSDSWTGQSGSADYSLTGLNQAFSASGDVAVTTGANTLLLMPQTCPSGSKITVVMTIGGKDWTLESSIAGHTWAPGKNVTYVIKPSNDDWLFYMVDISNVPSKVSKDVATDVAVVKSFRQHALGIKEAVAWSINSSTGYSVDGGSTWSTKPSWLSAITPTSGSGGSTGETINATATECGQVAVKVSQSVSGGDEKYFTIMAVVPSFSVSATKKVQFAPGNLQAVIGSGPDATGYVYTASSWKFAEHQYDYIGNAAGNTSFAVGSTVDLFGWVGASASYNSYGLCTNTGSNNEYYGTSSSDVLKTDWGSIPDIVTAYGEGWFTLSNDEWYYLFETRSDASSKYGQSTINSIRGLILLPDEWTLPDNCTFTAGGSYEWAAANAYTLGASGTSNAWCDMEAAGAVFLPVTGSRQGTSVADASGYGYYLSSTTYYAYGAYYVYFISSRVYPNSGFQRMLGQSVRLVKEVN